MSITAVPSAQKSAGAAPHLPSELPPNAGRIATGIAIVLVAQLMLVLDMTVVNVALPRIDADLGFGPAALSWVLNGYTLAFGGLLLLGGRLGDVFGRRRVFMLGLSLFTLASLIGGLAQDPAMLVASRAFQGIGAALAAPGVLALLVTSAPDEAARNRGLALFAAVSSGGGTLGLLLGGIVTDLGSWRWTMFINVPIGLTVLLLVRRFVDETPRRPGRFDFVGAAAATGGAIAIVWSLIGAPDHGWTSARTVTGLAVGAALLGVLAATERRVAHPMLRPELLRNRQRVGAILTIALVFGAQLSMFFLAVQYVQQVLGFGPLGAGLAILPLTVGIFTVSRFTPRLVARFGPQPMQVLGTLGLAASFVWISGAGVTDTYASAILGPMLLNGVSAGLAFLPIQMRALGGVEPEHAGAASGLMQTMQQLGGAVGLAVIVSVYAAGATPGEFVPGVREAFLASAVMALLAALVTLVLNRAPRAAGAVAVAAE
jgi:EmrB/QacA subfamily drug resistance transporter